MNLFILFTIILTAILSIGTLYATQPLQPLFVEIFSANIAQITLFTSILLFSLAISPIFYGYLLEKFDTKKILSIALFILGFLSIILCFCENYYSFLAIRICEAVIVPATLTGAITTLTRMGADNIQKYVSIYVAATVFGGVLSRIGSGLLATFFSWQMVFATLGGSCILCGLFALKLPSSAKFTNAKITINAISDLLKDRRFILLYFGAFSICFCFQCALNFMPFEIKILEPQITSAKIGFLYSGYIIGIITALLAGRIKIFLGGDLNSIIFGFTIFAFAPLIMWKASFWTMFIAVFIICIGMFIAHSVLSSFVNSLNPSKKGITNGMYLALYYLGGTIGTTLPSYLYSFGGWYFLCGFVAIYCVLTSILFFIGKRMFK